MISPKSIPLKYTGWKNQHSQVSSKPGRCLHVTEETVRYFDSNKWLWLVMTAVKRSGTTEEYSAFVIRKDSEGVFLLYGNIYARSIIISEMLIGVPEINI